MKKLFDKMKKNNKGFTLVELIVVIAVLAIITVVAAPQYIKYVEKSKVGTDENAIGEIAHIAEIQWVELKAADKVEGVTSITVKCGTNGYTVSGDDDLADSVSELIGTYKAKSDTYKDQDVEIKIDANGNASWKKLS